MENGIFEQLSCSRLEQFWVELVAQQDTRHGRRAERDYTQVRLGWKVVHVIVYTFLIVLPSASPEQEDYLPHLQDRGQDGQQDPGQGQQEGPTDRALDDLVFVAQQHQIGVLPRDLQTVAKPYKTTPCSDLCQTEGT